MYNLNAVNEQINTFATLIKSRVHLHKSINLLSCLPNQELIKLLTEYDKNIDVTEKLLEINKKLVEILAHYIAIHNLKNEKYRVKDSVLTNDVFFAKFDRWPILKRRFFQKFDEWDNKTEMKVNTNFKCLNQSPSIQVAYAMQNFDKSVKRCHPLKLPEKFIGKHIFDLHGISDNLLREIYTDQDYYIHLLKQLVNTKGVSSDTKHQLEKEHKELYERKKGKSNARESKERRIRYVVHDKLEHFMEPAPPTYRLEPQVIDLLITSLFK